jgi:1-acyl-sn-glycerol-3-phosphate acyltransferase
MLLYDVLKVLLRPALRVFYAQTDVEGRAHLPETGPLVVVANHPNTLLDPLLVGMLWRRRLRFLTSSRFFKSVGGWVLRAAGAIPLYRQEDHAAAEPAVRLTGTQRAARNDDSFRASFDLLAAGGALLIFPEGSSVLTHHLRPFKSGAARIALGAEARHGWRLGVQLVPVGLNYAAAPHFRSALFRRVGAPIAVAAYRARYEANPAAAIRALTQDLRRALAEQLLVTPTAADDKLLSALAPFVPAGFAARQAFAHTRTLLQALAGLMVHAPARAQALHRRLEVYYRARRRLGLAPNAALDAPSAGGAGRLLLGGVPAGWGVLHHYPAYWLPARLALRLTTDVEFVAAIRVALGMLLLPLCYGLPTALVWHFTHALPLTAAYLAALPLTGWWALAYRPRLAAWRSQWRVQRLARRNPRLLESLRADHAALAAELEEAGAEWERVEAIQG